MELIRMIRVVLWSFFGVRKSASNEADLANLNFKWLPFVAIVLALVLGAGLYGVVLLIAHCAATAQGF